MKIKICGYYSFLMVELYLIFYQLILQRRKQNRMNSILGTPDRNKCGNLIELDLEYPSNIHGKTKHFPFPPQEKTTKVEDFSHFMMEKKPEKTYPMCE